MKYHNNRVVIDVSAGSTAKWIMWSVLFVDDRSFQPVFPNIVLHFVSFCGFKMQYIATSKRLRLLLSKYVCVCIVAVSIFVFILSHLRLGQL